MARTGRPATYKELDNREFLFQKYVIENWSTVKIAKLFGCDPRTVGHKLRKFGIELRDLSKSHRIDGFEFSGNYNVLYGSLLGDGCFLKPSNKTGLSLVSFSKGNVNYDHVLFVGDAILDSDSNLRIKEYMPKLSKRPAFKFTTRKCDEFLKEYRRWYPEGKKIVPKDLILNSEMALHWFMDDGHSCWRHKRRNTVTIGFSTESFCEDDCNFLVNQLRNFDISCYLGKSHGGYGYKIFINSKSDIYFFDFIGPCPHKIPSMQYKWKISDFMRNRKKHA